jgi:hypothetical protein
MATETEPRQLSDSDKRYVATYHYLNQGKVWLPNGRPAVAIADMGREWRYNASRWMERRVEYFALAYSAGEILFLAMPMYTEVLAWGLDIGDVLGRRLSPLDLMSEAAQDDMDRWADLRYANPATWLKTTTLYQALVADLPASRKKLDQIAERAKHYTGCPQREQSGADCDCVNLAAIVNNEREIANGTPEWTDD